MDDQERFFETSLPEKENFDSHLNMEDITGVNYTHTKRVCENFEIKNVAEYYDLFLQSNKLLLTGVFGNF